MITSKRFFFIIANIYNILRYVIARVLRHMCNSLKISSVSCIYSLRTINSHSLPWLIRFWRNLNARLECLMTYAGVQLCIRTMDFIINCHLHHILDPILSLYCNVQPCQRDNFGPQYPGEYEPHLFHFLENDYLDDKLWFC